MWKNEKKPSKEKKKSEVGGEIIEVTEKIKFLKQIKSFRN